MHDTKSGIVYSETSLHKLHSGRPGVLNRGVHITILYMLT